MADLKSALDLAQSQSVQVYQRKVQIAEQVQQLQMAAQQCDAEFLRLDGEIRVLTRLVAESKEASDG